MNLIEELLKENKSFSKGSKKKKVTKESLSPYYPRTSTEIARAAIKKAVDSVGGKLVKSKDGRVAYKAENEDQLNKGKEIIDKYIKPSVPKTESKKKVEGKEYHLYGDSPNPNVLSIEIYPESEVDSVCDQIEEFIYDYDSDDLYGIYFEDIDNNDIRIYLGTLKNDPSELNNFISKIKNILNSIEGIEFSVTKISIKESKVTKEDTAKKSKKKVTKEFLDRSITIGDVGSGNSPTVSADVDAEVDADVKDSSFGAGGTGGDVIKKKDEEECLKESKEVSEDIINQLVVDLFDKLGLDIYDTDPDVRFDELVYAIYEIYQDHKHNVKEGILNKALDVIKDPVKSGVSTLLGDKEKEEEILKEGYSDNHIELKFKSGSTLDDDTYDRLFDITANGVAIEPSDDYEPGTPLPWDASIDIEGNKAIINGSLGPGGVDTDCSCEITLPVTKVNKYYNVYVDANEEDYDEVVDLLTKCNLM